MTDVTTILAGYTIVGNPNLSGVELGLFAATAKGMVPMIIWVEILKELPNIVIALVAIIVVSLIPITLIIWLLYMVPGSIIRAFKLK